MAELTAQDVSIDGVELTYDAADVNGDSFPNNGHTLVEFKNDDTSDKTVTIDSAKPCNYGFDHDVSITVTAGTTKTVGPFERTRFNKTGSLVDVSYDDVTSLSVAVIRI